MSSNTARIQWMQKMIKSCFEKDENFLKFDELNEQMISFCKGELGKTLLIYYQKPTAKNEKNDANNIPYFYINEDAKSRELTNRACFFIRNVRDGASVNLNSSGDNDISFGEITTEAVIAMDRVIHNYLFKNIDTYDEWGNKIDDPQKKEFKKCLESFANEINETVDSLINGVKFETLDPQTLEFINQDKKDMISDENKEFGAKIEEIYRGWINVLTEEIERLEKSHPDDKKNDPKDEGPKSELYKWKYRMQRLIKVKDFFSSKDMTSVEVYFIAQKNKPSSAKFTALRNDMKIKKVETYTALSEARDNVKYLETLEIYFDSLYNGTPDNIIDSLQSLMNSLKLISFTARYYDSTKMTNLFAQISNQMIKNCTQYILDQQTNPANEDPTYLWERKPDEVIAKFNKCIELYEKYKEKYKQAKANTNTTNRENTFEFGENQLFGKFDQFKKRLVKLKDLFTTIKQFEEIRAHKLDSMEDIQENYDKEITYFKEKINALLHYWDTNFDKTYVHFNQKIQEIESNLHKNINEEFKKINWIEKKLKLLEKYEKILTKENLQENLKSEKLEIFSNYKRDIEFIQNQFDNNKTNPSLQRNMPTISGRIKWSKQLFNRIFPFINRFKDIPAKDRKETETAYMTANTLLYSYIILNESFFTKFVETAKTKLTLPLLVINENSSPKVNLDLYVLQLIREAKCMLRMNCEIPESAKIILLQEEKYKKYYNELTYMVKEYNRILSRIHQSTAESYYKAHIKDLNNKLIPLKTTINWSSMNIDSSLQVVFDCLQRFEYSIDSFMEILDNRVHRNMLNIRKLNLLNIPENPTALTINEIITKQEEHVKEQNEFLQSKNKEIETAVLDMIQGIQSYELDPKIQKVDEGTLYKLINDYEDKFYEFLIATTKNSLLNLKDRINGDNSQPIFSVSVDIVSNQIEITPKINLIQEAINKIAKSILYAMKGINTWKKYDSKEVKSFHESIGKNNEIIKMILVLTGSFQANSEQIDTYLKDTFTKFKPIYVDSIEKRIKEFKQKKEQTYADYEEKLNQYNGIQDEINSIKDKVNMGAVELDLTKIKAFLSKFCRDWKNAYIRQLLLITREKYREIGGELNRYQTMLDKKVEGISDLQEVVSVIEEVRKKEGTIEDQIKPYCLFSELVRQQFSETDIEKYKFASVASKEEFDVQWEQILKKAGERRDDFKNNQLEYKRMLYEDARNLTDLVKTLKEDYDRDGPTQQKGRVEDAIFKLSTFRGRVTGLNEKWDAIKKGEIIFNTNKNEYPDLKEIDGELSVLGTLYDLYSAVRATKEDWKDILFMEILPKKVETEEGGVHKEEFLYEKLEEMDNKKTEFASQKLRVNKKLKETDEYHNLEGEIDELSKFWDALNLLVDPNFQDYHYKHLAEVLGVKELENVKVDGGNFKLKLLFNAKVGDKQEDIDDEKSLAKQQKKVRDNLAIIDDVWKVKIFKFFPHPTINPELQLIDGIEAQEIKTQLEDHQGMIASFKASSRSLTDELRTKLRQKEVAFQKISTTLDSWLNVQTLWNNLQSFFLGGDIKKELPVETNEFNKVHDLWRKIMMDKAFPTKNVYSLCSTGELDNDLISINSTLTLCQNKLYAYLEKKRSAFPRFYFVSNAVLLDILSKRSDPANIKTNLGIIFDALNDIEFAEFDKKIIVKIRQLKNENTPKDKQEVDISQHPVRCDGKIEEWLCVLVDSMKASLKDLFEVAYKDAKAFFDIKFNADNRHLFKEFINKYICQVVIFGIQLFGTKRLEELIVYCSADKNGEANKKKLSAAPKGQEHQSMLDFREILAVLTQMCRDGSDLKLALVKLEALIIIHVHNIDIYNGFIYDKEMQRQKVTVNDYDWLKQTRVYWYTYKSPTKQVKTCLINITDVAFEYGYEFLGARERMCITPLTDKCYVTLAQAMGMQFGGAPAGPAGTGKTETVKDMGRTMGVFVLVTNCAPEHRYKNMSEIFKGLCLSGAWGCFDEFNRIQLDVLSVLATIVAAIQDCKKKNAETFEFPESAGVTKKIELNPTMGYFITMNPGYSGRQELPENLKVLFRGVTMMAPNRESIIRVKLCSYGFDKADDIAAKFRKLYELCEAQLSKQTHYDFGLRNILSVLRHGGNEKKKFKDDLSIEEELIYTALRNMNLSKFVPDDKPLFESLIRDVFPQQKNTKEKEYPELDKYIVKLLDEKLLDKRPEWKKKIIQMYETYHVRHGFMIVGTTGTGKTKIMEVLTEAMQAMSGGKDIFKIYRLNPKAVEDQNLFIEKIQDQYIMGTFTQIWSKCNSNSSTYSKQNNWVVCDGPIDSLWIENLNTVLDDNKILTLSNNERIAMADTCRLVMECENVKNASLATVSRCGMIYITERDITHEPLLSAWKIRHTAMKDLGASGKEIIEAFSSIFPRLINAEVENHFIKNFTPCMQMSWLIKVKNFLLLVDALIKSADKATLSNIQKFSNQCCAFAFAWAFGSIYEGPERVKFHKYLKDGLKFGNYVPEVKEDMTIFEYGLTNEWAPWETEKVQILPTDLQNFSSLLIPTMDSTRAIFLINKMNSPKVDGGSEDEKAQIPVLILGDSGTSKTSTVLLYAKTFNEENKKALKRVNFSSATSPSNFQQTVDDELEKSGNDFIPVLDRNLVIFLDDLSMPYVNKWGDQVTLELARQLLEFGGYYFIDQENNRGVMKNISKISFLAAMNHPKGGKNDIPNRLKRHFFIFNMVLPNEQSVDNIYGTITHEFFYLKGKGIVPFNQAVKETSALLPKLTADLLKKMSAKFQPTPIKFHYFYNMRELARTFQGIFRGDKECLNKSMEKYKIPPEVFLICLWKHEVTRVFCDKLRDIEDIKEYNRILEDVLNNQYENNIPEALKGEIFFADYMRPKEVNEELGFEFYNKYYENIETMDKIREATTGFMNELNGSKLKHVEIVLFDDCLKNLMRVTRVIQQDQGSCMIVGVGGSGKQSLSRLASYCEQCSVTLPAFTAKPSPEEMRNVFKTLFDAVISVFNPQKGKDWQKQTLLLTDAEFKIEYYLEAVSSFLATGEIANLYGNKNDKNNIISQMRSCLSRMPAPNLGEADESVVWNELISTCKKYIHLSLCFSPSGDGFRNKFIKFPVLFNNCTIIWLLPWPETALQSVANGAFTNNKKLSLYADEKQKASLLGHIAGVHIKISEDVCAAYYDNFRRHVYVTPKSFLSFVQEYMNIYVAKDKEISERADIINGGLSKLKEAEEDIKKQNVEMAEKQERIKETKKIVDEKEAIASKKAAEAEAIEKKASAIAAKCEVDAKQIGAEKAVVERELALAEPALIAAQKSIQGMEKNVIQANFKSKNIAPSLKIILECSAVVLGKRLLYQTDFGNVDINKENKDIKFFNVLSTDCIGTYINSTGPGNYFATCDDFVRKLDSRTLRINDETLELIRPFLGIKNKDGIGMFTEEVAGKLAGDGGKRIANFCRDISEYVKCIKDVIPKMKRVAEMEKKYSAAKAVLDSSLRDKEAALAEKKKIDDDLAIVRKEREEQQELLNKMIKKVTAAQNLLDSLKGEKTRWIKDSEEFDTQRKQLLGDAAISSAFIAYGGPFNYTFRKDILLKKLFKDDVESRGIPFTPDMDIKSFLVAETTKDVWLGNGLPNDELSIQNGILVTTSSRFPLLIDPQEQAKNWLKNTYEDIVNNKQIIQMDTFCKKFVDNCSRYLGLETQVMIEGIENEVDSAFDPILQKEYLPSKTQSKIRRIKIQDNEIEFHTNFKLFLLCKLINPHFSPELAAKTTIIDFCVTAIGLEQQLQAMVISKEQKILEDTIKQILVDIAKNKASLYKCQEEILENLRKPGNLLENEEIVQVLKTSQTKSEENKKKIKEAQDKAVDINIKRDKYLPVASRGSVLYFSIVQMQDISKMYSVSLQQFVELFNKAIDNADKSNNPDQRVKNIVKKLSEDVYKYVVRGLFEKHKTAFILLVCCKILTEEKVDGARLLAPSDINFFTKCDAYVQESNEPDCPYEFLCTKDNKKPKEYLSLLALTRRKFNEAHMYFQRLPEKINADPDKIKNFYNSQEPENCVPYEDLFTQNKKLVSFLKLCFVRALREDKTITVITTQFVPTVLEDRDFLRIDAEDYRVYYDITSPRTPILFLLSAGADPSSNIESLARKKNKKLENVSMGEGQKPIAQAKVQACIQTGDWVYFQNCHLGLDFMSWLDITLKESEEVWNDQMRIWLSCEPSNQFPIGLLHQSLKVTNEPPKGIGAGMAKTYSSVVSAERLDIFEYKEWRNLVFALSFIHSLVIERRKYGALGFCVPYDFNDSDLEASILFVEKQFSRESDIEPKKQPSEMINFKTLTNVVSGILYGGRITDLKDENLFKNIVSNYLESNNFTQPNFVFYKSNQKGQNICYSIPDGIKEINQYQDHIKKFPVTDPPEVFGLHGSADMTFRLKEFKELMETLTTALPKDAGNSGGESKEEMIKKQIEVFINDLPENFNEKEYRDTINAYSFANLGKGIQVPLNNVLLQEIQDVQSILANVRATLYDVRDALNGTLLMTETITECIDAFTMFKPPKIWMFDANGGEISWLSTSAAAWFKGLVSRADKLREWLACQNDQRPAFYLPGFLKPQGFLAAFRQEYYRLKKGAIAALDQVDLKYEPDKGCAIDPKNAIKPQLSNAQKLECITVYGLYIEGAIWGTNGCLADDTNKNSRNTIIKFPVLNVRGYDTTPGVGDKKDKSGGQGANTYSCPLYKYPKRTDKYIITDIKLRIGNDQDDKFWQRRGVALLCNNE